MIKDQKTFRIRGTVVDSQTLNGLASLRVEAWDKDAFFDDALGKAETDEQGAFEIAFGEDRFQDLGEREPDVYFKVYRRNYCLCSTEKSVLWNRKAGDIPVRILAGLPGSADEVTKDYSVKGTVRLADGGPAKEIRVVAFDRDLRCEQLLGQSQTDKQGFYQIHYSERQFRKAEKGNADLVVKAFAMDSSLLAASPVLFNSPPASEVDINIPSGILPPPALFEKIGQALELPLEGLKVEELEEDNITQDLSFLSGETGFEKATLARFVLAHRLAHQAIQAEFWFVLLDGSFYQYSETQSLKDQSSAVLDTLPSLDATAARKAINRGFNQKDIDEAFRKNVDGWIESFLRFIASRSVSGEGKPAFVKLALEDANVTDTKKQETFARLFNEHKALTPELLQALAEDPAFEPEEIADLSTSFQVADITRGDFSVVKMIKEEFGVRQPGQIRLLAKNSEAEWVKRVQERYAAGDIALPFEIKDIAGEVTLPAAEIFGKTLERRFREAFPTTAFAGGLERALQNGGAQGLRQPEVLGLFLDLHPHFELLNTTVDDFLNNSVNPQFQAQAKDEGFRLELMAVQRVFKLAPTFGAADALLADNLHSAQQIYRLGQSEFVRRYENQSGFTTETARLAWNRAADTHAAVLTVVADLKALESEALPLALRNDSEALANFPNWENLFKSGDLCECEHCRSVLSPAAYFADLLMFLKDRNSKKPRKNSTTNLLSAKDILFNRRPDLGFIELNCENALTTLPYIDVVCEVLEDAVDATGENDLDLKGFNAISSSPAIAKTEVAQAFKDALAEKINDGKEKIEIGTDFSLSQLDPKDPDRWVVHSEGVSYLLKKKPPLSNFFAEILRNSKASAAELRAYPQYVNPKAYGKLRAEKYPFSLPFDLFGEEVRAAFQKTNLQRWDLMRTLRGAAPNHPTDGDIAAEYFAISGETTAKFTDSNAPLDEKRLILLLADSPNGQRAVWGEEGNAAWLDTVDANGKAAKNSLCNVKYFLWKTGLEYNELLALLDLKFVNPAGDIAIRHLDPSCDTGQKVIQVLDEKKLDRIHRFLRLWRKLKGWKLWELDLAIDRIGKGVLDEAFLINLFHFSKLKNRLGGATTVEQVCALFGDLNTQTRFTRLHEKREDAHYQSLFLNKRLINPLDAAFQLEAGGGLPAGENLSAHQSSIVAALGVSEVELVLLKQLARPSVRSLYINDDLNLGNLSFLWRHSWLSRQLKFKAEEWKIILKLFLKDIEQFADPKSAWDFVVMVDQLKATGLKPDELNWLLAADPSAKIAPKEDEAIRFLLALRKELDVINAEFDPQKYAFLAAAEPTDSDKLVVLLSSILQKLKRDEAEVGFILATLRGNVRLEAGVPGLPVGFNFPSAITSAPHHIPIQYVEPERLFRFAGLMTEAQRQMLDDSSPALQVLQSIQTEVAVDGLPAGFSFPGGIVGAPHHVPIQFFEAGKALRFTGVMTDAQRSILLNDDSLGSVKGILAYRNAVENLHGQSLKSLIGYRGAIDELYRLSLKAGTDYLTLEQAVALPENFTFPDTIIGAPNHIPIRYHKKNLRFTGVMTSSQRDILLKDPSLAAVAGKPEYSAAIRELFDKPRKAVKFFEPVFTASLTRLPAEVDFKTLPAELAAKIAFDDEQELLRFNGIMSGDERERILLLSRNPAYVKAVDEIVEQPRTIQSPDERIWLTDEDLDITKAGNDTYAKRLANAINKALNYLSKTAAENVVVQQSSAQLVLSEAVTRRLLSRYAIVPSAANKTVLAHLTGGFSLDSTSIDLWFWTSRAAALVKKWKLSLAELKKTSALADAAALLDFVKLPFNEAQAIASIERFFRTSRLFRLRDSLPETRIKLLEVLEKLQGGVYMAEAVANPATTERKLFAADVELLNEAWLAADVEALIAGLDLTFPTDYFMAENWERLSRAFYFLDNLNARARTAATFAAAAMDDTHAKTIKELLRSKFGAETWLALSAEIQDVLRERKRDALAAYVLTRPRPADVPTGKWENTNDLYAYYLLDVEMSSCQLTNRLVQGAGSVQLFVQRCFMGLERDVPVKADGNDGDSAWRWWRWMSKYRVWEANRKVFLWPENWIEPELKKDRSPFFKDLENELMQNEINQHTAEDAFTHYLDKLDGVAQLEIMGFYQEDDADDTILHVFGRTKGAEPHLYYYRRYDYRQWTPWEKVDLDIHGEYLTPAVINKRLFLFWPIFMEIPDEQGNSTVLTPGANQQNVPVQKAKKRLEMRVAVSEYRQGKWMPKRVSTDSAINPEKYDVNIIKAHYQFFAIDKSAINGSYALQYRGHSIDGSGSIKSSSGSLLAALIGDFDIAGCKGLLTRKSQMVREDFVHAVRPVISATGSDRSPPGGGIKYYDTVSSKWIEVLNRTDKPEDDFAILSEHPRYSAGLRYLPFLVQILRKTPGLFAISPPWHLSLFDQWLLDGNFILAQDANRTTRIMGTWLPFYYNDDKRTFFVLPSLYVPSGSSGILQLPGVSDEGVRNYYPEIKTWYRHFENYFGKGIAKGLKEHAPLPVSGTIERQNIETFLWQAFPEQASPPYSDEQLTDLRQRWFMRSAHLFLGVDSLNVFQLRQFHFKNHYHPFVCDFTKLVYNPLKGIPALMSRETQLMDSGFSFKQTYQPTEWVVDPASKGFYPREDVDFTPDGAYSPYNWELFFHAPLLIANSLSKNQRFEEARDWYHFIFNPLGVESSMAGGSPMSKYWITKPFFETTKDDYTQQRIDNILRMLAGDASVPGFSAQAKRNLEDQVRDWRTNPFEPHRIANYRTVAYQKTVVMKYLDNLVAWGDFLFRQDSMESINEATQLYVMAAEILGPRPKKIPLQNKPPVESFNELEEQFDKFSNALIEAENLVPTLPGYGPDGADSAPLPMLYFCIPQNEKLLGYWDTVADRLYKIRHCMNIEGVERQLALFEPPVDPGALVKAIASGVDIGSALADLNAAMPLYRFNVLLQKANEVCNDVKALGSALLSALEKKDTEELSRLRQGQEILLLEAVKTVRETQIKEAKENLEAVNRSKAVVEERRNYYRDIKKTNTWEDLSTATHGLGIVSELVATILNATAGTAHMMPLTFTYGVAGFGGSPVYTWTFGSENVAKSSFNWAAFFNGLGGTLHSSANLMATQASNERRWDEWKLQERLADKELLQMDKQIDAAKFRVAIAEKELENHAIQIENAKATDEFMRSKYTSQELYQWQIGQVTGVYFQSYKLAYDLAKRAERCLRFELGLEDSRYIQFGYWDSLKNGLLAGEKLQYDLRRLETAYLEQNRREFELTKHISLLLLDPLALVKLRETGRCFINLPEEIFDLDYPGHYFRRIKSVSITLPCVVGPYTTISCTLRLLKNSIRTNTVIGENGYPRNTDQNGFPADDSRFIENAVPVHAMAASSAQNDSGVFELSFRDERYLPFEGAGAISQWSLELFNDANADFGKPLRQFDYGTISDAILHVKYTAREDAGRFKNDAITHLRKYFSDGAIHAMRLFNLRQEFPTHWRRFLNPTDPANGNIFELEMSPDLFRILDQEKILKVNMIWLLARCTDSGNYNVVMTPPLPVPPPAGSNTLALAPVNQYGGLRFSQKDVSALGVKVAPTVPPVKWRLTMTGPGPGGNLGQNEVEDVFLVVGYEWETP